MEDRGLIRLRFTSPRQGKTVPAGLIFNPIEFDGINYGEFARIKTGLGGGILAESFHVQTAAFNDAF